MPTTSQSVPGSLAARRVEESVAAFEAAWAAGDRPDPSRFLPDGDALRRSALVELVRSEIHLRRQAGETPEPTEYLARFPELAADPDAAGSLSGPSGHWADTPPVIEFGLAAPVPDVRGRVVRDLALADLEMRLQAGEPARVEEYLARYPELAADPVAVTDLACVEFRLRLRTEPGLAWKEYADRFPAADPALADRLRAAAAPTAGGSPRPGPDGSARLPAVPGYDLLGVLGVGGMGVVYRAHDTVLGRLVALKMVVAGRHAGPEARERLLAEARAVARLRHPNVVQVYASGDHDGQPFFAQEFCDGGTLAGRLAGGPLVPRTAAELLFILAGAVDAAHGAGVIHRDLKPSNVLLHGSTSGGGPTGVAAGGHPSSGLNQPGATDWTYGVPKIADFGLAKLAGSDLTATEAVLGTPSYMAPEQAEGRSREVGPAADVYSLGAILYECLTGRPPFQAASPYDTVLQARSHDPVGIRQLQPKVPRDLETICLKCLRKEPDRRYPTAGALAADLRRFLDGEPIQARPISTAARALKWARRHPGPAVAATAILLAGLGVLAVTLESSARLRSANRDLAAALGQTRRAQAAADANATAAAAAAAQARAETDRAMAESRKAQAVSQFLGSLFEASDPLQLSGFRSAIPRPRGEKLDAAEMLRRGARQLDERTDLDPDARALLLERIGHTLGGLGQFDESARLLTQARDLRLAGAGPPAPELGDTYHGLGWTLHLQGRPFEARTNYERALALLRARTDRDTRVEQSAVLGKYALLLAELEMFDAAMAMARQAIALHQSVPGAGDHLLPELYLAQATVAFEASDYLPGLTAVRKAIQLARARQKDDPLARAVELLQQGIAETAVLNQTESGVRKLGEAHDLVRQSLGERHLFTLITQGYRGIMLTMAGRQGEAERLFRAGFETARAQGLLTHPRAGVLFGSLCAGGRLDENTRQAQDVAEVWVAAHRALDPKSVLYADALTTASEAYARTDPARRERMLLDARAIYVARTEPVRQRHATENACRLALLNLEVGRWADAEHWCRVWLAEAQHLYRVDRSEHIPWATATRAAALARQGQFPSDLEADLVAARKMVAAPFPLMPLPPVALTLEVRLSEYYRGRQQFPAAAAAARRAAGLARSGPQHVWAAEVLAQCAAAMPADPDRLGDAAIAALGKAAAAGYRDADRVTRSDALRPLADRPGFRDALARMRVPPPK